ncbi:anaerobic benzoate catabolism transcriptional regulator [Maioricimonas rarisocia]|uniref:Anaerobic benzoate catabolism transcriptional regulator n=1 Tax=Maioricimonas rarisocia TaxID=2528026 RepID=A0A517Z854_9PLAN|nr:XRE family transcriptional regulator [Maioricimonas rarisocia]QDU38672.1 anaerobic benzoate catabolism transcriptional regulator [Maioricimonas rarisocia]
MATTADTPEPAVSALCRRIRELRSERDWTLEQLSRASGVSRSMLSQIERNQANPTLAVALRIAQAFGLTIGELMGEAATGSTLEVIRAADNRHNYRSDETCSIRTLSPLHLEKDVEFYEVRLAPRGTLDSAAHFRGTREFLTVTRGKVRVRSGNDASELETGDSVNYPADVPHSIENTGRGEAVLFLVVIYR